MIRWLYSALMTLAGPALRLRLGWRARKEPLYGTAIGERFGRYPGQKTEGWIWVHAVSLGETRAAASLISALREREPSLRLLLTNGTATGRAAGVDLLCPGDRQVWLPWDSSGATRRFLAQHRPRLGILMETEIWPNLIAEAAALGVPMVLANARLSERSRRRGRRVDRLLRPAFQSLAAVFAQTEDDAERLRDAGARDVSVEGNLKFDLTPDPRLLALGREWKSEVAPRRVALAAVTREGEEASLLAAWRGVATPRPLLAIVPRHPQRFEAVAELIANAGYTLSRRSAWGDTPPSSAASADVWLGDSMQEMPAWYVLAQVALLGGSFAPLGGQNLIEAAACGCPVVMGPHTYNFKEAAELALAAGAATRVQDMAGGVAAALVLASRDGQGLRDQQSHAALAFALRHRGAAARMASRILAVVR